MNKRLVVRDAEAVDKYLTVTRDKHVVHVVAGWLKPFYVERYKKIGFGCPLNGYGADLVLVVGFDEHKDALDWFRECLMVRLNPGADVVVFGENKLTEYLLHEDQAWMGFKQ